MTTATRYTLTPAEIVLVAEWLARHADHYYGQETGWDTAAMTDDCVYFLALQNCNNHIYELITAYAKNQAQPAQPAGPQDAITVLQLRQFLFALDDQTMTIEQLRGTLFIAADQQAPMTPRDLAAWVNEVGRGDETGTPPTSDPELPASYYRSYEPEIEETAAERDARLQAECESERQAERRNEQVLYGPY